VLAALALALALALWTFASAAWAAPVLVCHATASESNPFKAIVVDDSSTTFQGHLEHEEDFISDEANPEQLSDEEAEAICDAGPPDDGNGQDDGDGPTPPVVDQYGDGKDDAAHDQYGDGKKLLVDGKKLKDGVIKKTIPKGKKVLPDTGGGGGMLVSLPALGLLTLIVGGAASGLVLVRRR
jgi:hypothetical protein